MPHSDRRHARESFRFRRIVANIGLLTTLPLLLWACGPGEAISTTINVKKAEWRGERVWVSGEWARGISTPPLCRVLEGFDGPASNQFVPDARVTLDGNTFSKEFVPVEKPGKEPSSEPRDAYHVRCTVSLDSGRSAEDTVKVGDAS